MTEEDNRIILSAEDNGFRPRSADGRLTVYPNDLVIFFRKVRLEGRDDVTPALLATSQRLKEVERLKDDLQAENCRLYEKNQGLAAALASAQARLAGIEGLTDGKDGAKFLIVDTDNFNSDYPNEKVIARVYLGEREDAVNMAERFHPNSAHNSRYAKVERPGYKLAPGFEP